MSRVSALRSDHQQLELAVATLRAGGIVAHATEGVWGLACDPFQAAAVQRLLALKQRPVHKGLILLASRLEQVLPLLKPLPATLRGRIEAGSERPVTWLVPCRRDVPALLRGEHATLAIRLTDHAQARALIERFGLPIVSTSANPGGRAPARSALRVRQYFGRGIDYILPGALGGATGPSEIRRVDDEAVLRRGG